MSVGLRGDTALKIGMSSLSYIWYFSLDHVEKEFLAVVALNLYGAVYEAREVLPTVDLTVISSGMAARRLLIFSKSSVLGTECIIPDERQGLREVDPANCLTFVQTSQISRRTLFSVVEHFPIAKAHLKKAATIYTLRSAFRAYYKAWRREAERSMSNGDGGSFYACRGDINSAKARTRFQLGRQRRSMTGNFQEILASIEQAKRDEAGGSASFNKHKRALQVRRGGRLGQSYHSDWTANGDDLLEDEHVTGLRQQLRQLKDGQEAEAARTADLVAHNEALELRFGVLDQKLELMLSLLTRSAARGEGGVIAAGTCAGTASACPGTSKSALPDVARSSLDHAYTVPPKHERVTDGGVLLHRRRKARGALQSAACAVCSTSNLRRTFPSPDRPGVEPRCLRASDGGGHSSLNAFGCIAATTHQPSADVAQLTEHQRERQELRETLEA